MTDGTFPSITLSFTLATINPPWPIHSNFSFGSKSRNTPNPWMELFKIKTTTVSNRSRSPQFGFQPKKKSLHNAIASYTHYDHRISPLQENLTKQTLIIYSLLNNKLHSNGNLTKEKFKLYYNINVNWPLPNVKPFKRSSTTIPSQSWNYRGCWHQTCPPLVFQLSVYIIFN